MDINISITLIVTIVVAIYGIYYGGKKGFAKGLSGFIALVATLFMLGIFIRIYYTYTNGQTMDLVVAIIALVVLGIIYGVLKIITRSVKAIAGLPVIAVIDRILGALIGLGAIISIYHIVVVTSRMGYWGIVGQSIMNDIANNKWLEYIASHDVIEIFLTWKQKILA